MTRTPTLETTVPLKQAAELLAKCERAMIEAFEDSDGRLQLTAEELRLFLDVLDLAATTFDDLNDARNAVQYFGRLIQHDRCGLVRQTNATLEYEYCSGRYFSRSIILLRNALKRPELASQTFRQATALRFNGERVHWWTDEWQIPTLYMRGLRSKPFWKGLPMAKFLEENYAVFKEDFLAVMAHPEYNASFTQNDHSLITAGTWGELKLFTGKEWRPPCADVARRTCDLLRSRPELVGRFHSSRTHNVELPKETGYFQLLGDTRLKPHTGPVNFNLYCHLGLVTPPGARLSVGRLPPRPWQEGKALCFDDSFVHEAWHDGTDPRYVLMVTFWHPELGQPDDNPAVPKLPGF